METHVHKDPHDTSHQRHLAQAVMRRQLALSLKIAAVFLVILIGLPLVNYFMPGLANLRLGGFTLTWFFLAVLFYPVTWFLSWMFIKHSNEIEADIASSLRDGTISPQSGIGVSPLSSSPAGNAYVPASTDADNRTTPDNANTEGEPRQ